MRKLELTGKTFNNLTVLHPEGVDRLGHVLWKCRCTCGNLRLVRGFSLRKNLIKSCGCIKINSVGNRSKTHGKSKSLEYKIWTGIKNRCTNINSKDYKSYGGRGIKVCDRWLNSFENFLEDMGERENLYLSIDRIDTNGDYEPSNCKWATIKEQSRNKRNSIILTYKGETKDITTWCEELGLNYNTVKGRLFRYNYSIEEAFEKPLYAVKRNNPEKLVHFRKVSTGNLYEARIQKDNRIYTKSFSIRKFGESESKKLATEWAINKRLELDDKV